MVPKMLPKFNKKIVQTVNHNIFAKRTCKYTIFQVIESINAVYLKLIDTSNLFEVDTYLPKIEN